MIMTSATIEGVSIFVQVQSATTVGGLEILMQCIFEILLGLGVGSSLFLDLKFTFYRFFIMFWALKPMASLMTIYCISLSSVAFLINILLTLTRKKVQLL